MWETTAEVVVSKESLETTGVAELDADHSEAATVGKLNSEARGRTTEIIVSKTGDWSETTGVRLEDTDALIVDDEVETGTEEKESR